MLGLDDLPDNSDLSDGELVARVVDGHHSFFAVLMRRHNQRLYRTVRAILRSDVEAEDALQQAYLSAFRSLRSFRGASKVSTWLTKIAANAALARHRERARSAQAHAQLGSHPPPPLRTPADAAIGREMVQLVEEAIDRLPDAYRLVVMLRDVQEMTSHEVADVLGLSVENVRVRLHRGRALLRQQLNERMAPSEPFAFAGARCDRIVLGVIRRILPPADRHADAPDPSREQAVEVGD